MDEIKLLQVRKVYEVSFYLNEKTTCLIVSQQELDEIENLEERLKRHANNLTLKPKQTFRP